MTDARSSRLSARLEERIAEDFARGDRPMVTRLLADLEGPGIDDTVRHAILTVAEGDMEEARAQADLARIDYRDVLWNAQRHSSR